MTYKANVDSCLRIKEKYDQPAYVCSNSGCLTEVCESEEEIYCKNGDGFIELLHRIHEGALVWSKECDPKVDADSR